TNLRTNLGDGGVDTEVRQDMLHDNTGWFNVPTCWQYKATTFAGTSSSNLRKEINKPYSTELIKKGYGYRFCICDDLTPEKKSEWTKVLDDEIRGLSKIPIVWMLLLQYDCMAGIIFLHQLSFITINFKAPEPKVITASDLADWASRYPAIVVRFFKPELIKSLSYEDWGKEISYLTEKYVEIKTWAVIKQRLVEHLNFDIPCQDIIFSLQGEAGVGKTRFVYETVSSIEGVNNLVLYYIDNNSLEIVYEFIRDKSAKLLLVVDECLLETQQELKNRLSSAKDRARVVCIDNSGERIDRFTEQIWLERIPEKDVDTIIKQNFSSVPSDIRRACITLCRGFIRLAADLCNQYINNPSQENISSFLIQPREYLRTRLSKEELKIVEALSLFQKVGYRDEVKEELDLLCEFLKLNRDSILEIAEQLKDVPGYVVFAGRYLYITPAIIATVSFEGAWKRWINYDPPAFLDKIPQPLLDAFLHRVSTSSSEEVRRIVGDFFQRWVAKLQPIDLSNISKVEKFIVLIEINPEYYLPQLTNLVQRASREELLQVTGGFMNSTGTRRPLVWLAEKMAAFPEFFSYAETILWELALTETESNIANNATNVLQQLFRIFLSGTAVPFTERIDLLEKRLFTEDLEQIDLALKCLKEAFGTVGSRVLGSSIVAGRITPEDWQPKSQLEIKECLDKSFSILYKASKSNISRLQTGAFNIAIELMPTLLANGYLAQLQSLFSKDNLTQETLISLVQSLENFLSFQPDPSGEIKQWLQSLTPQDFHGRLIQAICKVSWSYYDSEGRENWQQEINNLAQQLCQDRELLKSEMDSLVSPKAIRVAELGSSIGQYDANADCLNIIMESVAKTQETGLARGYIIGLLSNYNEHNVLVNEWIDKFETQSPTIAYELSRAGGHKTRDVERTLKLVDTGSLDLEYLGGFFPGSLSVEEFYEIIKRLVSSVIEENNQSSIQTVIKLISRRLNIEHGEDNSSILEVTNIQNLVWQFLEATAGYIKTEEYNWVTILKSSAKFDISKTIEIASLAILSKNDQQKMRAEEILVDLAKSHPDLVMQSIGDIILDDEYGWHFEIERYRFLIQNLPLEAMKQWLSSVGVAGARRIVKQLSLPYLDKDNNPVVPPLTEFVLSEFEDDEGIFRKFCVSSHNLQTYIGDIALQKTKEAEIAISFLDHPLRRIREWASYEIESCQQDAQHWTQIEEESKISLEN
ncbi:MAG: hypothetical protein AB4372_40660, partial [Xenococcus sp. (in: cyanobacteria)]